MKVKTKITEIYLILVYIRVIINQKLYGMGCDKL